MDSKSKALPLLGAIAFVALILGAVASLIFWDWKWVAAGGAVLLVLAVIDAARGRNRGRE